VAARIRSRLKKDVDIFPPVKATKAQQGIDGGVPSDTFRNGTSYKMSDVYAKFRLLTFMRDKAEGGFNIQIHSGVDAGVTRIAPSTHGDFSPGRRSDRRQIIDVFMNHGPELNGRRSR